MQKYPNSQADSVLALDKNTQWWMHMLHHNERKHIANGRRHDSSVRVVFHRCLTGNWHIARSIPSHFLYNCDGVRLKCLVWVSLFFVLFCFYVYMNLSNQALWNTQKCS